MVVVGCAVVVADRLAIWLVLGICCYVCGGCGCCGFDALRVVSLFCGLLVVAITFCVVVCWFVLLPLLFALGALRVWCSGLLVDLTFEWVWGDVFIA